MGFGSHTSAAGRMSRQAWSDAHVKDLCRGHSENKGLSRKPEETKNLSGNTRKPELDPVVRSTASDTEKFTWFDPNR
jgi:hypothetical protein